MEHAHVLLINIKYICSCVLSTADDCCQHNVCGSDSLFIRIGARKMTGKARERECEGSRDNRVNSTATGRNATVSRYWFEPPLLDMCIMIEILNLRHIYRYIYGTGS